MLQANQLKYAIGDRILFENINFAIDRQEKVGLIGVNGTGKSTLLKILAGQLIPDEGNLTYPKDYLIDFLPQEPVFDEEMSIIDYILKGELPVLAALREYESTLELLDEDPNNVSLTKRLVSLQEKLDLLGGWELESQIKTVLTKLNIHHLSQNVLSLSGGQKKRVALAASIIRDSDLLILDEPTNHLDEITIQWLENFLLNKKSSILLVTHDRYFLDRITNKIFELDRGTLYSYLGNYSTFVEKKAERIELATAMESKRANLYRTELAWMRRGARARTTKQKARIDRFNELENQNYAITEEKVNLLSAYSRLGKKAVELHQVGMSYAKPLFRNFSAILQQGDRIGIIGQNGVGKTTLLNLIAGVIPPKEGNIEVGPTVKIGYFTQHFPAMTEEMTLIEYIRETAEYVTNEEGFRISASVMLERFLFDKSNHYSPIAKLSGGERRRLYLLKILMESPNIILLDEPTNDLDIDTLKALEDYLDEFIGIVIVVSHDRYFIDRVCSRIYILRPDSTEITIAEGNYSDYLDKYGIIFNNTLTDTKDKKVVVPSQDETKNSNKGKTNNGERKLSYNEKRELESLPNIITKLENELDSIERKMKENPSNYSLLEELLTKKDETELELLEAMERLETLS